MNRPIALCLAAIAAFAATAHQVFAQDAGAESAATDSSPPAAVSTAPENTEADAVLFTVWLPPGVPAKARSLLTQEIALTGGIPAERPSGVPLAVAVKAAEIAGEAPAIIAVHASEAEALKDYVLLAEFLQGEDRHFRLMSKGEIWTWWGKDLKGWQQPPVTFADFVRWMRERAYAKKQAMICVTDRSLLRAGFDDAIIDDWINKGWMSVGRCTQRGVYAIIGLFNDPDLNASPDYSTRAHTGIRDVPPSASAGSWQVPGWGWVIAASQDSVSVRRALKKLMARETQIAFAVLNRQLPGAPDAREVYSKVSNGRAGGMAEACREVYKRNPQGTFYCAARHRIFLQAE